MKNLDDNQVLAIRTLADAVECAIREAGPNGIPSGHLYAALSSSGVNFNLYTELIVALKKLGRIQERGNVLTIRTEKSPEAQKQDA